MLIHEIINKVDKEKRISKIIERALQDTYQEKRYPKKSLVISIVIRFKDMYMLCSLSGIDKEFVVFPMRDDQHIYFADSLWHVSNQSVINTSTLVQNTKEFLEFLMTKNKEDIKGPSALL